jgi:HK97 family phage major capsid protein
MTITEKKQLRASLVDENRELLKNETLTKEQQEKFDSNYNRSQELKDAIEREERQLQEEAELDESPKAAVTVKDARENKGHLAANTLKLLNGISQNKESIIKNAVEDLAKGGHYGKIKNAAGDYYSTAVSADGATLLPTVVQAEIDTVANEYGVARQVSRTFNHVRGTLKRGGATGTLPASAVSEGGAISAKMRSFKALSLNPAKWAVIVPWTYEANLELAEQILGDVNREIGESFAKAEDDATFNGDGSSTYNSITGLLSNGDAGELTLASGNTSFEDITPDNLILARNEVPSSLRKNGVYVFHPDMEAIFLTKKDSNGAYIFDYNMQGDVPTLKGRPVYYTESLPGLDSDAADTSFGVYGDFRYWIMAIGEGISSELLNQGVITDADSGASINLSTQDLRALKFREFFDAGTNFGSAFMKFTTAAS